MSEQKSLEQIIMEAIDFCTHTRCKKCEYYGVDSTYERNGNCRGRMMADHLRKNGVVVREKGEWEPCEDFDFISSEKVVTGFWCSKCGVHHRRKANFCPNCGADMRKRENG